MERDLLLVATVEVGLLPLVINLKTANPKVTFMPTRVAGLGRLSAGAKMAMKPFVKRVFTIFATNASFLRVISNFRI